MVVAGMTHVGGRRGEWEEETVVARASVPSVGEDSRSRLLATARRLFAERGLDAVSLREVVRDAGIKHATAVQYHFGDREGLMAAILAEHETRVDMRRNAMLDNYEADAVHDCRTVAAIMVRPLARELEDLDGRYYLRICAQVLQRPTSVYSETETSIWRWRRHAEEFLPAGAAELHPRYSALAFTVNELARRAVAPARRDDQLYVSRIIDVVSSIISCPMSPETERLLAQRAAKRDARKTPHP